MYEDDTLPEEGKAYVFLAYTQDDGSLLVSGPNSNKYVEDINQNMTAKKMARGTTFLDKDALDVISEYKNAYEDEKTTDRDRSISKFDNEQ
ncbi:hypothetical protein [Bacillus rubiinfantis]|uniref:hypothetical protein n=1 Tax=Bacillus rubiinfantis TaxID=1499680 RepID=UPI0006938518|nr:hypothetical protein [Bacillus rubiinfantis]